MRDDVAIAAPAAGPLVAFALAAVTVPFSGQTFGRGLLVALVVVVLATRMVGGRGAALVTALMAALSFDFFHVAPIRVLHMRTLGETLAVLAVLATARRPLPATCSEG